MKNKDKEQSKREDPKFPWKNRNKAKEHKQIKKKKSKVVSSESQEITEFTKQEWEALKKEQWGNENVSEN